MAIDFGAELMEFDGSLLGGSRHLPTFQTPLIAQFPFPEMYQSVKHRSARCIFSAIVTDWL
jgi:hypothetical protein